MKIGTAGWNIPKGIKPENFAGLGSHLERYARAFTAVEINSAFYRDHKRETYERWAATTPDDFRFSVKLLKRFTHEHKLTETEGLRATLDTIAGLGSKWGALLVQLPPKLSFDEETVAHFFEGLRELYQGAVVLEPRHPSWSESRAVRTMREFQICRVLADPEPYPISRDLREDLLSTAYFRLHGSPEMYRSRYDDSVVERVARAMKIHESKGRDAWCIFDNTTFGFSTENALDLCRLVTSRPVNHMAVLPTKFLRSST